MAYIETHQSLLTHRKTLRLARLIGIDRWGVAGRLMALWTWALDNAQEGVILKSDSDILADVMGWESEPDALCGALVSAGFLDEHDGNYAIHDWWIYAGRLIEKRKSDAERKRVERASSGHPRAVRRTSDGHPMDVAGTLPYPTLPYPTVPSSSSGDNILLSSSEVASENGASAPVSETAAAAIGRGEPKKKSAPEFAEESEPYQLAMLLRDSIKAHKPDARLPSTRTQLVSWARPFDLMMRLDKRAPPSIRAAIKWATADHFWQTVILSPGKFRDQYDQITMRMRNGSTKAAQNAQNGKVHDEAEQRELEAAIQRKQERDRASLRASGAGVVVGTGGT